MKARFSPHSSALACHRSLHEYCLIMIIMTICRTFFFSPEPITRVTGEMGVCREEKKGLPWWQSQRVGLYVSGHVTNIWLNCCYARARHTEGHLTSIAGSNRRLIQLNLFAISVCGSGWLRVWCSYCQKSVTLATSLLLMTAPEHWSQQWGRPARKNIKTRFLTTARRSGQTRKKNFKKNDLKMQNKTAV